MGERYGSRTSASPGNGMRAMRLLQAAAGPRLFAMQALLVVVLVATAQTYDGSVHPLSHWLILSTYAASSLGLGLAERWDRTGRGEGVRVESRRADGLAWVGVALNAAVVVYIEVEHLLAGSAAGDDAAGAMSRMPAFLLLLQTGLSMRVWHTAAFAGVVTLAWSGTILAARVRPDSMPLGPSVNLDQELAGLVSFIAASFVVIDGVRRLRAALVVALRLEQERALLARFVPDSVSVRLAREGGFDAVRPRHACLFLLDIRGFSAMSRDRPQDEVVRTLLDVRALTRAAVGENEGLVDKYIGDGILAHFLAGTAEAQVGRALDAARAIRTRLAILNLERSAQDLPPVAVTIVLHAGTVLAGVFDDGERAEFTAMGPAMNILSRLEARAKAEDVALAASGDVVDLLPTPLPDGLDAVRLERTDGDGRAPALFAIRTRAPALA